MKATERIREWDTVVVYCCFNARREKKKKNSLEKHLICPYKT